MSCVWEHQDVGREEDICAGLFQWLIQSAGQFYIVILDQKRGREGKERTPHLYILFFVCE